MSYLVPESLGIHSSSQEPRHFEPSSGSHPLLAGALYCNGALDHAIYHTLAPFLVEARALEERISCWFLRYGKRGEHIKLRIYGPRDHEDSLRELFESAANRAWARIPFREPDEEEKWVGAPAIGPEDEIPNGPEDRCLLWTDYRRSPSIFGAGPLLDSDHYVSLLTRCLTTGCERALSVFEAGGAEVDGRRRRRSMLRLIVDAMSAVDWPRDTEEHYLAYHRDSILRFLLVATDDPREKLSQLLRRFERHASKITEELGSSSSPSGGFLASRRVDDSHHALLECPWRAANAALQHWLTEARFSTRQDPFARMPSFTPFFKVLHIVANALGIGLLNECFLYHLLLLASGSPRFEVPFEPGWEWV